MEDMIIETEKKWRDELYGYVGNLFSAYPIPSHDQDHHLRVWMYARDLIRELQHAGKTVSPVETEDLILACFFHDTGLIRDDGPEHGKTSGEIFKEYLQSIGRTVRDRQKILEAIENHDDKNYPGHSSLFDENGLNILKTLAVCDDLDAFGRTGIYRYAEIYIMRGIPMEDLGLKIMANLSGRFSHFISTCSFLPGMIRIHVPRHNVTEDFFRNYNLQLRLIDKGTSRARYRTSGCYQGNFQTDDGRRKQHPGNM